jgi:AraC-like DNA-binding protein
MDLTFAQPAPALSSHISAYYRIRLEHSIVEDTERADVGYLRFILSGKGYFEHRDGTRDYDCPILLLGPSTATSHWKLTGPLHNFGCVLLPEFWGGIVDADATDFANRALDGSALLGPDAMALCDAIGACDDVIAMGKLVDEFLIRKIKPLPSDQVDVIRKIGDWLRCSPIPSPDILYQAVDKGPRQVMRIANRHFGAPPSMLARKFRALRTASRLIGSRGQIPEELIDEYSDQAHLSREVKTFTGLTPRQLQVNSNPVLLATLHPSNFRADAPWT